MAQSASADIQPSQMQGLCVVTKAQETKLSKACPLCNMQSVKAVQHPCGCTQALTGSGCKEGSALFHENLQHDNTTGL